MRFSRIHKVGLVATFTTCSCLQSSGVVRQQVNKHSLLLLKSEILGLFSQSDGYISLAISIKSDGTCGGNWDSDAGQSLTYKGRWRLDGDVLCVDLEKRDPLRLVPVKWGARYYLFREEIIEGQIDRMLKQLGSDPNRPGAYTFVKIPFPKLTEGDFNTEPIIPCRYLSAWKNAMEKHKKLLDGLQTYPGFKKSGR